MSTALYTFSSETLADIRKFRFASARSDKTQAVIYIIEKESYQIKKEDDTVIESLEELAEELPDNMPRFAILSHPMKLPDGRVKNPLVLVYWIPPTSHSENRMLYAGAVEMMREKAGVAKIIKLEEEEDFEDLEEQL